LWPGYFFDEALDLRKGGKLLNRNIPRKAMFNALPLNAAACAGAVRSIDAGIWRRTGHWSEYANRRCFDTRPILVSNGFAEIVFNEQTQFPA